MSLVLVTGASTGLGLATARELIDAGHDVVLHARREGRVEDPSLLSRVHEVLYADLADPAAVRELGARADELGRFDAVIHNAGVMSGREVVAVNLLAPYVLSAVMTPPRRAVFLSSSMHHSGADRLPDQLGPDSRMTYSDTKLWVTALAMAIAARSSTTASHAVDPGWVPTRMGGRGASDDLAKGHLTQVWLATAPDAQLEPPTGGYWYHRSRRQPHPVTHDPARQDELLELLREATGHSLALEPRQS